MSTQRRELQAELFGRKTDFTYSEHWIGYALLSLRLVMGWSLFYAGITKVLDPEWSAGGFLLNAIPEGNPFMGLWTTLGNEWLWLIDPLNQWGLTLVGLALIFGAFVRWSAFWGAVMMLFYWLASFPLSHAILIDDHVVYALLLFGLGAFGAGRILGLDQYVEKMEFVQQTPALKYLLG
jgi:thiosulfate dehydrogenase [quinone] large subunit